MQPLGKMIGGMCGFVCDIEEVKQRLPTILMVLAALFILAYIIFAYVYTPWSLRSTVLEKGPVSLSEVKIYPFLPVAQKNPSHTFTFYVYPTGANRTQGIPSQSILRWKGLFSLDMLPLGASNKSNTGIQLTVNKVQGQEIIACPALPLQKWTYVSISIEGRRFDIGYNGKIVVSKILDAMPASGMSGTLQSGDVGLRGTLAFVAYNNRRMSADEILIDYVSSSNTRGEPYLSTNLPGFGTLFSCPAGAFCMKPTSPPNRAALAWYTPYS